MPGEGDAGLIDHAFMHGGGNHAGEVAINTALAGAGQGLQHIGSVGGVELARNDLGLQWGIPDIQAAGRRGRDRPVSGGDGQ